MHLAYIGVFQVRCQQARSFRSGPFHVSLNLASKFPCDNKGCSDRLRITFIQIIFQGTVRAGVQNRQSLRWDAVADSSRSTRGQSPTSSRGRQNFGSLNIPH